MKGRETKQEQTMETRGYLTYRKVAELLGITKVTVGNWATAGKLAVIKLGSRKYVEAASLNKLLGKEAMTALGIKHVGKSAT